MPFLRVTGGPFAPSGKTLTDESRLIVVYDEAYVDGSEVHPTHHSAEFDTGTGGWKPFGASNGVDFYLPGGADGSVLPPICTMYETQVYSDGSRASFIRDRVRIIETSAGVWHYPTPRDDVRYVDSPDLPPANAILESQRNQPGGFLGLDSNGKFGLSALAGIGDLSFLAAAQLLGSDNLYLNRSSDTGDPNKRTNLDELIIRLLGSDAAGITPFYEKGTFVPTLYGTGSNPSVTYYVQEGIWVRIGALVHVEFAIGTSSVSGGSGNVRVGQMPFDSATAIVSRNLSASGLPLPGAAWGLYGFGNQTSRGLRIFRPTNGGSMSEMLVSQWPAASNASFSATVDYLMHIP